MKRTKLFRVIAIILCLAMLLCTTAFAAEPRYIPDAISLTVYAGKASLSSFGNGDFGHAFISIENYSGKTVYLGKLAVPSGQSACMGDWNDQTEHRGLYYNRELHLYDRSYWSLTRDISESQLYQINNYISKNDYWDAVGKFYTCSVFAAEAWNLVCSPEDRLKVDMLPTYLENDIKNRGGAQYGVRPSLPYGKIYFLNNGVLTLSKQN